MHTFYHCPVSCSESILKHCLIWAFADSKSTWGWLGAGISLPRCFCLKRKRKSFIPLKLRLRWRASSKNAAKKSELGHLTVPEPELAVSCIFLDPEAFQASIARRGGAGVRQQTRKCLNHSPLIKYTARCRLKWIHCSETHNADGWHNRWLFCMFSVV